MKPVLASTSKTTGAVVIANWVRRDDFGGTGGFADGGRRHAYTIFYAAFPCPLVPDGPLCACRAWALHRGSEKYETAGFLHRFRRNRRSNHLRRRSHRRALVPGNKSAGIPQRLLLRAVGRMAARREGGLSSGSNNSRAC